MTLYIVVIFAIAAIALLSLWRLHRACIYLEDKGFIYYRQKSGSSSNGGVFMEADRLIRPSGIHVIERFDSVSIAQDESGDSTSRNKPILKPSNRQGEGH